MICPKCSADTKVKDSRPHADDPTVIRRRRHCEGCGHRFETQEGTVDIVRQRSRKREARAAKLAALSSGERAREAAGRAERRIRQHLRETGIAVPASLNP